jgi:CRP-like cAMP-binding protein
MPEQDFAASHVFFRPGDPGDRAYLLHDGQVELLAGADGAFTRVELFQPGDVFGEMALIEERPRDLNPTRNLRSSGAGRASRDRARSNRPMPDRFVLGCGMKNP